MPITGDLSPEGSHSNASSLAFNQLRRRSPVFETSGTFDNSNDHTILSTNVIMAEQTNKYIEQYGLPLSEAACARRYIDGLGMTLNDYRDKYVLDAGSGRGDLKKALSKMRAGATVVNFDDGKTIGQDIDVIGEIEHMPFADNTFDIAIANSAFPWDIDDSVDQTFAAQQLRELVRVVKKEGIVKYTPLRIGGTTYQGAHMQRIWDTIKRNALVALQEIYKQNPDMKIQITRQVYGEDDYYELLEIIK